MGPGDTEIRSASLKSHYVMVHNFEMCKFKASKILYSLSQGSSQEMCRILLLSTKIRILQKSEEPDLRLLEEPDYEIWDHFNIKMPSYHYRILIIKVKWWNYYLDKWIWVRSWSEIQTLIAKPPNKTDAHSWPDPSGFNFLKFDII